MAFGLFRSEALISNGERGMAIQVGESGIGFVDSGSSSQAPHAAIGGGRYPGTAPVVRFGVR